MESEFDNPSIDDVMDDLRENYLMDFIVIRSHRHFLCTACNSVHKINYLNSHVATQKHMCCTVDKRLAEVDKRLEEYAQ